MITVIFFISFIVVPTLAAIAGIIFGIVMIVAQLLADDHKDKMMDQILYDKTGMDHWSLRIKR